MASVGALFSGQALVHRHSDMDKFTALAAVSNIWIYHRLQLTSPKANYLRDIAHSSFGFTPAATVFSVPKALLVWCIIFLTTEICILILERVESKIFLTLSLTSLIVLSVIILFSQHIKAFRSIFGGTVREEDISLA